MLRRLRRKWWFWVGLAMTATVGTAAGGLVAEWHSTRARGEAQLAEAVARLDAAEPGWRARDLCAARNAALPPAERNAAVRAVEAYALIPKPVTDWSKNNSWRTDLTPGVLPAEPDLAGLEAAHAEAGRAVTAAVRLKDLPGGGIPLTFAEPNPLSTLLPHAQKLREVADLLDQHAVLAAARGDVNEAIAATRAAVTIGRAVGDEPTLISQLVRMAIGAVARNMTERTLGWGEPDGGLAELQAVFAEEAAAGRLAHGIRGERASFHLLLSHLDAGSLSIDQLADGKSTGGGSPWDRLGMTITRKHIPAQQAYAMGWFDEVLAADRLTGPARLTAFDALPIPPRDREHVFIRLLLPAVNKVAEADVRTRAQLGTASVALACERHRRQFGSWPVSLDAIPKTLLPSVPADPYSGEPLRFARTDDGVAVYSTGPDLIDDGGNNLNLKGEPGTDVGFRLLDPAHRRRPAPLEVAPEPRPVPGDGP